MNTHITSSPDICGGESCFTGTRIPVSVVLSHLAAGDSYDDVLKNFPRLSKEDILAALEFAAYL